MGVEGVVQERRGEAEDREKEREWWVRVRGRSGVET